MARVHEPSAALTQPLLPPASGTPTEAAWNAIGQTSDCVPSKPCFLRSGELPSALQKQVQSKLLAALLLCLVFMVVQLIGGYMAHSVAILADAAHMMSDAAGFAISLFAAWAVTWRGHSSYSFGFHRAEIIGALLSTLMIWGVTGALVWEAILRVLNPEPVDGKLMFIIACAGIACNLAIGLVLGGHHHHGLASHSHEDGGCGGHGHSHSHSRVQEHAHTNEPLDADAHGCTHDHEHSCAHSHGHEHTHSHTQSSHTHSRAHSDSHAHQHDHVGALTYGDACAHAHEHNHGDGAYNHVHERVCAEAVQQQPQQQPQQGGKGKGRKKKGGKGAGGQQVQVLEQQGGEVEGKSCGGIVGSKGEGSSEGREGLGSGEVCAGGGPSVPVSQKAIEEAHVVHMSSTGEDDKACSSKPHLHHGCTDSGRPHAHGHVHEQDGGCGHGHAHGNDEPGHVHDEHGHGHSHENMNMRSALLHVVGDLVQSIGVALAGLLIWFKQDDPRWALADPICTFVFAGLVLLTTQGIIMDIIHILMERTPVQHDLAEMCESMIQIDGVHDVHDLHVWNLSLGLPILSAHVNVDADAQTDMVLKKLEQFSRKRGIRHSTVQICNPSTLPKQDGEDLV